MALRLETGGYSTFGNIHWAVYIYGPGTGTISAKCGADIFTKRYEGSELTVNAAIIPSSVSVTLMAADQSEVDAHEALLSEIALGNEGDFILKITKNGVLDWVGLILADQIQFADDRLPRPFTIRAVDGLARLKEIEFNKDGTEFSTVPAYLSQHIIIALQKTGLWAELNPGLKAATSWTCAQNTLYASFLEGIRLNHIVWLYIDSKGASDTTTNKRSKTAWQVLEEIARAFHARVIMSQGSYWFIQVPVLLSAASAPIYTFDSNGTVVATTNGLPITYASFIDQLMGASWEYQAAVKRTKITYRHASAKNISVSLNFISGPIAIEGVESFSGTAKIFISFTISYPTTLPGTYPTYLTHAHKFRFTIKVGNYYLKRTSLINLGQIIYGDPVWTTVASDYEFYVHPNYGPNGNNRYNFNLVTPPLPANGNAELSLFYAHTWFNGNGTNPVIAGFNWFVNNGNFQVMPSGLLDEAFNETVYTQESSITATKQVEITSTFGDGPFSHTLTTMKARRPEGTEPPITQSWTGSGLTGTIHQVLAASIIKLAGKPAKKLNHPFIGDFDPIGLLESDSAFYLLVSGDYNAKTNAWNGVFIQIADQPIGITLPPAKFLTQGPSRGSVNIADPVSSLPDPVIPDDGIFNPPDVKKADVTALRAGIIPVVTTSPIEVGTINQIQVEAFTLDNVFLTGDQIILTDVKTGAPKVFTVSAPTTAGATVINVSPTTVTERIVDASYVQLDPEYLYTRGVVSLANVGAGAQVYKDTVTGSARLRSILAGSGISVSQNANDITISAVGGGTMSFFQINGDSGTVNAITDGETLLLVGGSGITTQVGTNQITINLNIAELTTIGLATNDFFAFYDSSGFTHGKATIQDILNLVPAGFTSFTISASSGAANSITNGETLLISGGAGVSTFVSTNQVDISLNIAGLTAVTAASGDYLAIYDVSTGFHRRITVQDILNLVSSGSMSSFAISADSGTPNSITDSETLTISGGTALNTVVSTNQIAVNFNLMELASSSGPTTDDWLVFYDNAIGAHFRTTIANVLSLVSGGGFTSFNIAGDSGTSNAITNGETLSVAGGTAIATNAITNGVVASLDVGKLSPGTARIYDKIPVQDYLSSGHKYITVNDIDSYIGIKSGYIATITNSSGLITLTHGAGSAFYNIVATLEDNGGGAATISVYSKASNSTTFIIRDYAGNPAVSDSVSFYWILQNHL